MKFMQCSFLIVITFVWCSGCVASRSPRIVLSQHVFDTPFMKLRPAEPFFHGNSEQLANVNNYHNIDFFVSILNDTNVEWLLPDGRGYNGYNAIKISIKTNDGLVHDIVMKPTKTSMRPLASATVISKKSCLTVPISLSDSILSGIPCLNLGDGFEVRVMVYLRIIDNDNEIPIYNKVDSGWHVLNYQKNQTMKW
jgi:hypothetical protein